MDVGIWKMLCFEFFIVSILAVVKNAHTGFKDRNKLSIFKPLIAVVASSLLWSLGLLTQMILYRFTGKPSTIVLYIYAFGYLTLPYTGVVLVISYTRIVRAKSIYFIYVIPAILYLLLIFRIDWFYINYDYIRLKEYASTCLPGPLMAINSYLGTLSSVISIILFGIHITKNWSLYRGTTKNMAKYLIPGIILVVLANNLKSFKLISEIPYYINPAINNVMFSLYFVFLYEGAFKTINRLGINQIITRMDEIYFILDKNLNLVGYSDSFIKKFGSVKKYQNIIDILGKHLGNERLEKEFDVLFSTKKTHIFDVELHMEEAALHYVLELKPIILFKTMVGTTGVIKNATNLLNNEKLRTLGVMVASVNHNLRTPLMALAGNVDSFVWRVSKHEILADEAKKFEENAMKSICDMRSMVKTLTDYCGANNLEEKFTLDRLVEEIQRLYELTLLTKEKAFNLKNCDLIIENKLNNFEIKGSFNILTQIIMNLVINAGQAYEKSNKESKKTIKLLVDKQKSDIIISVTDYGVGIDIETQSKIFKQFTTTKGDDGTGIALYAALSQIKKFFDGNMWFDSVIGEGTTFYIKLPIGG